MNTLQELRDQLGKSYDGLGDSYESLLKHLYEKTIPDLEKVNSEDAVNEIIRYKELEEFLLEIFGEPHSLSTFWDRGGMSIFCALPDNFSNDTLYDGYSTYDAEESYQDDFNKDYNQGIPIDEYHWFSMNSILAVLSDAGKIKSGSYIIKVNW